MIFQKGQYRLKNQNRCTEPIEDINAKQSVKAYKSIKERSRRDCSDTRLEE